MAHKMMSHQKTKLITNEGEKMIKYSKCCGKYLTKETVLVSKNILQTSKVKEIGKLICSRCKKSSKNN